MFQNIELTKVNNGDFEGTIQSDMLPKQLQSEFGVLNDDYSTEIDVCGEFTVTFEDRMVIVSLESITLSNNGRSIDLDLYDKKGLFDGNEIYELEEKLTEIGYDQDWYSDHLSTLADRYNDDY